MIEGALEADGRIAAKNAVKIRAALRELADYKEVFLQYQDTHPVSTDNLAKDRARARAWAIMNLTQLRTEALASALWRMWAEAYVLGDVAAGEWIQRTRELNKADDGYIDWSKWQPGDRAAAIMLKRPKAFQQILDNTGASIRGMTTTSITDIGNALADAVELGLDAERAAVLIGRHVASPARALTIAITEQNRVMSAATIARYKEAELEKMEWHVSDPCAKCAQNANVEVPIGTSFPSGNTQPPAHPHCRCVLLPVIPGMEETDSGVGGTTTSPTVTPSGKIEHEAFAPGAVPQDQWKPVNRERWVQRQEAIRLERGFPPANQNQLLIMSDQVSDAKAIYERGPNIVMLDKSVETVTDEHMKAFMKNFDTAYEKLPEWRKVNSDGSVRGYSLVINNQSPGGGTLAYTYIGHDAIWFSPKDVVSSLAPIKDYGNWFMPAANTTNENLYTIMHELGHTADTYMNDKKRGPVRALLTRKNKELFSRYSRTNTKETYAEVFAQWGLGEPNALTEAYSKAFGWDLSAAEYYEKFPVGERWKPSMRPVGSL